MSDENRNILVVDDEQHQLETICRGLFIYGYTCHGVRGADEAIGALTEDSDTGQFDLLLTDLTMPGNSGMYLIQRVQKDQPQLPIIVITGLAATKEVDDVRAMGIPILQKPFEPDTLDKAIREALEP